MRAKGRQWTCLRHSPHMKEASQVFVRLCGVSQ